MYGFKAVTQKPGFVEKIAMLLLGGVIAFTTGCGGGNSASSNPTSSQTAGQGSSTSSTASSMVQVRIGDAPADKVVAFELTIGGPINLTSSSGTKSAVTLAPNRLELSHMSAKFEPFSISSLPQGTYTSADLIVQHPEMTFVNTDGTLTTIEGPPTQTVTVTFNPPVTIGAGASTLNVDLNVANSISADSAGNITGFNFSSSSFGFVSKPVTAEDRQQDDDGELENITGLVTAVAGTTMTVKFGQTGASLAFVTDSTTKFSDGVTSAASALNQIVRLEGVTRADGTLFAKEVEGMESSNGSELEGLITRVVGNPAVSLDFMSHDGSGAGMDDSKIGARFTIDVSGVRDSKFRVAQGKSDFDGLQVPGPDFPFDGSMIHAGQRVEVESATSVPAANGNLSAEKGTLQQQALSGTISNVAVGSGGASTFDLTLATNSALAVLSGQTTVHVLVQPGTDNRIGAIANGSSGRVRGLLFWTGTGFKLIARRITQ